MYHLEHISEFEIQNVTTTIQRQTFFFCSFFVKCSSFSSNIFSLFERQAPRSVFFSFLNLISDYTYNVSLEATKRKTILAYCSYIKKYLSEVRNVQAYKIKHKDRRKKKWREICVDRNNINKMEKNFNTLVCVCVYTGWFYRLTYF